MTSRNMNPSETGPGSVERQLFIQSLEKPAVKERAAFLGGVCGNNPDLRRRSNGDISVWMLPEIERVLAGLGLNP